MQVIDFFAEGGITLKVLQDHQPIVQDIHAFISAVEHCQGEWIVLIDDSKQVELTAEVLSEKAFDVLEHALQCEAPESQEIIAASKAICDSNFTQLPCCDRREALM